MHPTPIMCHLILVFQTNPFAVFLPFPNPHSPSGAFLRFGSAVLPASSFGGILRLHLSVPLPPFSRLLSRQDNTEPHVFVAVRRIVVAPSCRPDVRRVAPPTTAPNDCECQGVFSLFPSEISA